MSQQTLTVVVEDQDQPTAAESAAAAALESIQSAGVLVIAATFGGSSLLPTPVEALRAKVNALAALVGANGTPSKSALQAAVLDLDTAAAVVESAVPDAVIAPAPAAPGGFALPDEPAPAPVDTPAPAPAPADNSAALN